jgi:hypothetical protein
MAEFADSRTILSNDAIRITTIYLIRFQRVIKSLHNIIVKFLWKVRGEQAIIPYNLKNQELRLI